WAHVGDSRLYRFQGRHCLNRTEDHSLAQLKLQRGEIAPEQLASDPDQHKLLRGLGGPQPPEVEHGGAILRVGQTFVLCSDGVWEQLSTPELRRLSRRRDQASALREALQLATTRGGEQGDNAALILLRIAGKGWMRRYGARFRRTGRARRRQGMNIAAALHRGRRIAGPVLRFAAVLAVLAASGCTQVNTLKG